MKLQWFRGGRPILGDELNTWMWPRLLPGFFDGNPRVLFLGIGSIIGTQYDTAACKVVFGAGYVPAYTTACRMFAARTGTCSSSGNRGPTARWAFPITSGSATPRSSCAPSGWPGGRFPAGSASCLAGRVCPAAAVDRIVESFTQGGASRILNS